MARCANHPEKESATRCKLCKTDCCSECSTDHMGICNRCGYKVLIVLFIVMVVASYAAWFSLV